MNFLRIFDFSLLQTSGRYLLTSALKYSVHSDCNGQKHHITILSIAQRIVYATSDGADVPWQYRLVGDAFKAVSRSLTQGEAYQAKGKSSTWRPHLRKIRSCL